MPDIQRQDVMAKQILHLLGMRGPYRHLLRPDLIRLVWTLHYDKIAVSKDKE